MKRRSILKGTGALLGALCVSELGISVLSDRYARTLAAPTARKLALLVGINAYRDGELTGCTTDVEMQRELLVHRFGFRKQDVLVLKDEQATRSRLESAITHHLIKQAKPGDVVVIHFSGYGSLLKLGPTADDVQPALITADEPLNDAIANALPEETLFLLLRSLQTDQITTVLDTSYVYPGYSVQGSLKVRSLPMPASMQLEDDERLFQAKWLEKVGLDRAQVRAQRRSGQMPGVVLAAAGAQQVAMESSWNGFSAGLFTYALTQQLWQAMPETTLRFSLGRTVELLGKRVDAKQQPILIGKKSQDRPLKPYLAPLINASADGVVTFVEDDKAAQLWLGGLPPDAIEEYGNGSLFTVASQDSSPLLQIYERNGLSAKARFVAASDAIQVGQSVREVVRVLPRNLALTIAIDSRLNRIERVDAVSALSALPNVTTEIAAERHSIAPLADRSIDYLFGKTIEETQVATTSPDAIKGAIPPSSYGLFSQGDDVIPKTLGDSGEAVKVAVRRLAPQVKNLLATKLLSLTVNDSSSQLGVRATLAVLGTQEKRVTQQQTPIVPPGTMPPSDGKMTTIATGSKIQYRIENFSDQVVYFLVVGLDNSGMPIALKTSSSAPQASAVMPNATETMPRIAPNSEWVLRDPIGFAETYVICSRSPFRQTEVLLNANSSNRVLHPLTNFWEVAQAIVQDLHQASEGELPSAIAPDVFALDVNAWTTFRFVYQVV